MKESDRDKKFYAKKGGEEKKDQADLFRGKGEADEDIQQVK